MSLLEPISGSRAAVHLIRTDMTVRLMSKVVSLQVQHWTSQHASLWQQSQSKPEPLQFRRFLTNQMYQNMPQPKKTYIATRGTRHSETKWLPTSMLPSPRCLQYGCMLGRDDSLRCSQVLAWWNMESKSPFCSVMIQNPRIDWKIARMARLCSGLHQCAMHPQSLQHRRRLFAITSIPVTCKTCWSLSEPAKPSNHQLSHCLTTAGQKSNRLHH